jgi:hypothetical protein
MRLDVEEGLRQIEVAAPEVRAADSSRIVMVGGCRGRIKVSLEGC